MQLISRIRRLTMISLQISLMIETPISCRYKTTNKTCERKMKSLLSEMRKRISDKIYREINTTDGNYTTNVIRHSQNSQDWGSSSSYSYSSSYALSKYLSFLLSPLEIPSAWWKQQQKGSWIQMKS